MALIGCATKSEKKSFKHRPSNSSQKKKLNKDTKTFQNAFHLKKTTLPSVSDDSSVLAPSILAAMFTILRIASKRDNNNSTRALFRGPRDQQH